MSQIRGLNGTGMKEIIVEKWGKFCYSKFFKKDELAGKIKPYPSDIVNHQRSKNP